MVAFRVTGAGRLVAAASERPLPIDFVGPLGPVSLGLFLHPSGSRAGRGGGEYGGRRRWQDSLHPCPGASAEGLEVLTMQNEWLPVVSMPGQIVVNVGDMLQRLTNNVLRSTTHRVVNPPKDLWGTSRYSIPFFLHPRSDMRLDCLKSCVTLDNPKQYDDIRAGEYLEQRLIEIGLKK